MRVEFIGGPLHGTEQVMPDPLPYSWQVPWRPVEMFNVGDYVAGPTVQPVQLKIAMYVLRRHIEGDFAYVCDEECPREFWPEPARLPGPSFMELLDAADNAAMSAMNAAVVVGGDPTAVDEAGEAAHTAKLSEYLDRPPLDDPAYEPRYPPIDGQVPDVVGKWGAASQLRWFTRFQGQIEPMPHARWCNFYCSSVDHRGPCCDSCLDDIYEGYDDPPDDTCCCRGFEAAQERSDRREARG